MKYKEPREMAELHKIREEISKEWSSKSVREINQQLIKKTEKSVKQLKLLRPGIPVP